MKNFILSNTQAGIVYIVLVTVCMIIFAFKLAQKVGLERIRAGVYKAFILAEREFKYGDNKNKFEYVVNKAKQLIPYPYNLLISESLLRKTIQLWFDICKDLLDDGKLNHSQVTEFKDDRK